MEKWFKAQTIFTIAMFLYAVGRDLWVYVSNKPIKFGSDHLNPYVYVLCGVLLLVSAAMYGRLWPFNRAVQSSEPKGSQNDDSVDNLKAELVAAKASVSELSALRQKSSDLERELEQVKSHPPDGPEIIVEYSFGEDVQNDDPAKQVRLKNNSQHHTAYNVRVLEMHVGNNIAKFMPSLVPSIAPLQTAEVKARIEGEVSPLTREWFYRLFASTYKDSSQEELFTQKPFTLLVTFENKDGSKQFVTECEVLYRHWKKHVTIGRTNVRLVALKEPSQLALSPTGRHDQKTANMPTLPDFINLNPYPLELFEPPKYKPVPSSTQGIIYKNKVYFKLQNKWDSKADLWTPLWESKQVPAQVPLGSRFFNLGNADTDEKKKECVCITVGPYETVEGYIGLIEPNVGDGLEVRVKHRNTGRMIFPVKSNGKVRFAYIQI